MSAYSSPLAILQLCTESRIVPVFQPIVSVQNDMLIGFEVLSRLRSWSGQYIRPRRYIPIAEKYNRIQQIDAWVIEKAFIQLRNWREKGYANLIFTVNISAKSLLDKECIKTITALAKMNPIDAHSMILEVTESEQIENITLAKKHMNALRKFGIRMAADDFGAGFSSLVYLRELNWDVLKIDKLFIENLEKDNSQATILQAIVKLAQDLQLQVIVEGVETQKQYDLLQSFGVDLVQGYFIGKPRSAKKSEREFLMKQDIFRSSALSVAQLTIV